MTSPEESRQKAKQLVEQNSWKEALPLLESLWALEEHRLLDALPLIKVLRKLQQPKRAREVARQAAKELQRLPERDEDFWRRTKAILYSQAAWTIYDMEVKGCESPSQLGKACWSIRRTLEEGGCDLMDKYAPWVRSLLLYSKQALSHGQSANALKELDCADPAKLSPERGLLPNGKTLFSQQEQWFLHRSKALAAEQQWGKLRQHCEAGRLNRTLDDRTLMFLEFRLALALLKLGEGSLALELYRTLLARKREWWIGDSYAHALHNLGDHRAALREAILALLESRFFEGSVTLALAVGEWALAAGGRELAGLCRQFIEVTRQAQGWTTKDDLQSRLNNLPESAQVESGQLQRKLRQSLHGFLDEIDPPRMGVLQSILPNGKLGFVKEDSGESHALVIHGETIKPGDRLMFRTVPNWDRKKGSIGSMAIHARKV
jgi:hypothetical protein